jgi:putative flippase GtrA
MLSRHQREIRRLFVFGVMGTLNTAACYAFFALLVRFFDWDYNLALVVDYGFGALLGYSLHRAGTFADRKHVRQAFGKYAVTLVLAFLLNLAVLNATVQVFQLNPLPAQAIAILFITVFSYVMQRFWVFRSHHPDVEPAVAEVEEEEALQGPVVV